MKILVLNCGSSSIKYQLIDSESEQSLAKGLVSRIGMSGSLVEHTPFGRSKVTEAAEILDHTIGVEQMVRMLLSSEHGVIENVSDIAAVGHRIAHGGQKFTEAVLVTDTVLAELRNLIELAPLHNPHMIRGITACRTILSHAPQCAVFDTAFHHTIPAHAYIYGIPYVMYRHYGIRRYGFHGHSHQYVADRAAAQIGKMRQELNMITCHLGNGASITAIQKGESVDTSMGFTPLEGLLMGTRSGDVDPAIILHIMAREELTLHEANTLLNKHSGLQGISGLSSDVRDILAAAKEGNEMAALALDVYCYRIKKYIGSYTAALGTVDALVFTAGVGENSPTVRQKVCDGLKALGIELDSARNENAVAKEMEISTESSRTKVFAIPTNEELVIARETRDIVNAASSPA
jgi:acetate kinase